MKNTGFRVQPQRPVRQGEKHLRRRGRIRDGGTRRKPGRALRADGLSPSRITTNRQRYPAQTPQVAWVGDQRH